MASADQQWNGNAMGGRSGRPQPLYRREFRAADIMANYPPQWHHPNKVAVHRLACPPGCRHEGVITVSRWGAMPLPQALEPAVHQTELVVREDVFDYEPSLPPPAVEWHLNFAASDLFCAYGGGLFAQDEMQVAEHPALGSVREALLAAGLSTRPVEGGKPTPILVKGVQRRCRIATDRNPAEGRPNGLYGNNFATADESAIRRAVTVIEPPTVSNIVAIEAPPGGYGTYRKEEIEFILTTAFTGFAAARLESLGSSAPPPQVAIHTGFWGCGAYGGNRTLMALLQLLAAQLAKIDKLVFHTVDHVGAGALAAATRTLREIAGGRQQPVPLRQLIADIEGRRFRWGVSDGN